MNCPSCSTTLTARNFYKSDGIPKCGVCRAVLPHAPADEVWHRVLPSETAMYLRNPHTGEVRVEGRIDRPIHPKLQAAGFTERVPISTGREMIQFERRTGLIHEGSSYNRSGRAERDTGSC